MLKLDLKLQQLFKVEFLMSCWNNAMISPPSNGSTTSTIRPIRNLDPFDCSILPYPYNNVCQEQKVIFHDVVKPDCSRLPPE